MFSNKILICLNFRCTDAMKDLIICTICDRTNLLINFHSCASTIVSKYPTLRLVYAFVKYIHVDELNRVRSCRNSPWISRFHIPSIVTKLQHISPQRILLNRETFSKQLCISLHLEYLYKLCSNTSGQANVLVLYGKFTSNHLRLVQVILPSSDRFSTANRKGGTTKYWLRTVLCIRHCQSWCIHWKEQSDSSSLPIDDIKC